ncbi:hypothetical protein ACFFK0_00645 [Paenibacillus chartarius]|uniref:Uncharacterized protein n=1 Tax=Paenibacillus chartarius TaxID=747481 RepID=A0ABV6DEC1_9BACL
MRIGRTGCAAGSVVEFGFGIGLLGTCVGAGCGLCGCADRCSLSGLSGSRRRRGLSSSTGWGGAGGVHRVQAGGLVPNFVTGNEAFLYQELRDGAEQQRSLVVVVLQIGELGDKVQFVDGRVDSVLHWRISFFVR